MRLRRVLLLGGTGRLGGAVRRAAGEARDVALTAPSRHELDLATVTATALDAMLGSPLYDVVLNCAAEARVDVCETERAAAWRLNATAPGLLAAACARWDLPFIHVSTDYVFGHEDGPPGPHAEHAPRHPAQHYGASKAAGEEAVRAVAGRRTIARVSWLFGPDGNPFQDFVLGQARAGGPVAVFQDQASRPTWLPGLARWLLPLGRVMVDGAFVPDVLHPAGGPGVTRGAWARAILDAHGFAGMEVVDQAPRSGLAPRPRDSRLAHDRTDDWIRATWGATLPDWRDFVAARIEGGSTP